MEYIILDLQTATEEQLIAALDCNNRTARLMASEIEKLKFVHFYFGTFVHFYIDIYTSFTDPGLSAMFA